MNVIRTTLTTSGNSVAVRFPKELLAMSGLTHAVSLEAKEGQIIISNSIDTREGWHEQIGTLGERYGDPTAELADLRTNASDELDTLAWEGMSYEDWRKGNDAQS